MRAFSLPSRFRSLGVFLALTALGGASAQSAPAPAALKGLNLPPNYLSRFSTAELTLSSEAGFGARYVPLPTPADIRVSLVKQPNYWEYHLSTRLRDTTYAAGVFGNGAAAQAGQPKLEVTHDPYRGAQFSGLVQGGAAYSKLSAGYALTLAENRVRVLNNVGVAHQGEVTAPYTQSELAGGYHVPAGERVHFGVNAAARLYTFPAQSEGQVSMDVAPSVEVQLSPQVRLDATHFERFAAGTVAIPSFGFGRYQESSVGVAYRLPAESALGLLRSRLGRVWTTDTTTLRGDVLLNVAALPVLVGPSIGYQWGPTPETSRWLWSLSTAPK